MRIFAAVALIALLIAPDGASAQAPNFNLLPEVRSKTPEEKEAEAVRDKAYQESLKKIPDAKSSSDPWGTMRSGDAPKSPAKTSAPAKAKPTKTGIMAN